MYYMIKCDGNVLYHSQIKSDALRILSGSLTREINNSSSLTFSIDKDNVLYDGIELMKSEISVHRWSDTNGSAECLFRGRPISVDIDSYNQKTIVCEGLAGTLNDSIIEAYSKTGTPGTIVSDLISKHNSFVGGSVGFYDFTGSQTTSTFALSARSTAMDALNDICDSLDLTWYPEYTDNEYKIIIFPKGSTNITQTHGISYGANLISIDTLRNGAEMFSEIYPVGANNVRLASSTAQLNTDVKREGYRLKSTAALARCGRIICKLVQFPSASTATELQNQALNYLQQYSAGEKETSITAYDTGDFDGLTNFAFYARIPFSSPAHAPHEPEQYYTIVKLVSDLCDPSNDKVEVGSISKTLTKMI